jgi:hypothetical protein
VERIVFNVGPYSFTTSAFLIGLLLVQELSIEEQDSIGNWLQLVGLTMQTYASQKVTLDVNNDTTKEDDITNIDALKKTIKNIEDKLDELYNNK